MVLSRFYGEDIKHGYEEKGSVFFQAPPGTGLTLILTSELLEKLYLEAKIRLPELAVMNEDCGGDRRGKKGKKTVAVKRPSAADRIREDQLVATITTNLRALPSSELDVRLRTNIVEIILLQYAYHASRAFGDKQIKNFLNALLSLRNALRFFEKRLSTEMAFLFSRILRFWSAKIPWKSFLQSHSELLLRNHFGKFYRNAITPLPEQAELIEFMQVSPLNLFVLPWGVGCGKTACLAPIATIMWKELGIQTLYCVPMGPIRDQTAANLYRCGIPFAYIGGNQSESFEMQPSHSCSFNAQAPKHAQIFPHVYIVTPQFVRYYLLYWEEFRQLVPDSDLIDPKDNPPKVRLPNYKKRYQHLQHGTDVWGMNFTLVMDEPATDDPDIGWILHHLPRSTFIMSATNCGIVTEEVQESYLERYDEGGRVEMIPGRTIGVCTTVLGSWLEGEPVLSPFSGCHTREEFERQLEKTKSSVLWRRFLSPAVLIDWNDRIRREDKDLGLDIEFDFMTLTFDDISLKVITWADRILLMKDDDEWYEETFGFGHRKINLAPPVVEHIMGKDSYRYASGCVISVPRVTDMYDKMLPLLEDFPKLDQITKLVDRHREEMRSAVEKVLAHTPVKKEEGGGGGGGGGGATKNVDQAAMTNEKLLELAKKVMRSVPVPPDRVLNTMEFLRRFGVRDKIKFCSPLPLIENGDLFECPKDWSLECDFLDDIDASLQRFRMMGVGAIIDNKRFYMKSLIELDNHFSTFLLVDRLGSYGLNLKIKNAILMEPKEEDGIPGLPREVLLQVAGRVGRFGQESSGSVHVCDERLFRRMMY